MTPEEWQKVRPILESALGLDQLKRSSSLDTACPDAALRRERLSMLAEEPHQAKVGRVPYRSN